MFAFSPELHFQLPCAFDCKSPSNSGIKIDLTINKFMAVLKKIHIIIEKRGRDMHYLPLFDFEQTKYVITG